MSQQFEEVPSDNDAQPKITTAAVMPPTVPLTYELLKKLQFSKNELEKISTELQQEISHRPIYSQFESKYIHHNGDRHTKYGAFFAPIITKTMQKKIQENAQVVAKEIFKEQQSDEKAIAREQNATAKIKEQELSPPGQTPAVLTLLSDAVTETLNAIRASLPKSSNYQDLPSPGK